MITSSYPPIPNWLPPGWVIKTLKPFATTPDTPLRYVCIVTDDQGDGHMGFGNGALTAFKNTVTVAAARVSSVRALTDQDYAHYGREILDWMVRLGDRARDRGEPALDHPLISLHEAIELAKFVARILP